MGRSVQYDIPTILPPSGPCIFPNAASQEYIFTDLGSQSRSPAKQQQQCGFCSHGHTFFPFRISLSCVLVRTTGDGDDNDSWAPPYARARAARGNQP
jgi:hypothetical protein